MSQNLDGASGLANGRREAGVAAGGTGARVVGLRETARVLRRRGRIVLLTTAALVASAFLFVGVVTPLYTATSTILIDPQRAGAATPAGSALGNAVTVDASIESQALLIRSLAVIQRVVDRLNLVGDPEFSPSPGVLGRIRSAISRGSPSVSARDAAHFKAVETLERRLSIVRQPATFLIDINASSYDRIKAASIANTVAQAYFDDQARSKLDATKAVTGRVHHQLEQLKSSAIESDNAVQDYRNVEATPGAERAQHLGDLQREAEASRAIYETYLAQSKDVGAQQTLQPPDSRIVTHAIAPISPSFPDIPLILGFALLIGLALGCIFALAIDHFDRRIKTQEQARISGLPSLAALPEINARELAHMTRCGRADLESYDPRRTRLLPAGLQPPLLRYAITQPMSAFAEAIRSIRFALQHAVRAKTTQVISVTSAVSGEGKTTVAANLAQSLSVLGIKVVLVEGDLRNPQLSRALCPSVRSGLLEVALEEMPLNQAVLVDPLTNLAFIPAPLPKDAALLTEFASSEGMSNMLTELRNHFDVLIVDAPPLLPLVDGRALVEQSDAVILTVGWDRTPEDVFLRAVELLNPIHDRVIGTVLTRVDLGRLKLYGSYDSSMYMAPYAAGSAALPEAKRRGIAH